jgi:hypothetical protein
MSDPNGPRFVVVTIEAEGTNFTCELCAHSMLAHDFDGNCDDCELYGGVCDASHLDADPTDEP